MPESWKEADIVPILKPDKDNYITASYRSISILPCLGKLMERIVSTRLIWWLESSCVSLTAQCGFRPSRSTICILIQLEHMIHLGL